MILVFLVDLVTPNQMPFTVCFYVASFSRSLGGGAVTRPPAGSKLAQTPAGARVNPRPDGPLDFPPPAGGGGCFNTPRLSRLLRIVEQNGKRHSKLAKNHFEIISVIFWLRSKLRSPEVKIPKFSKTVFGR